jgi:hypothetical protein
MRERKRVQLPVEAEEGDWKFGALTKQIPNLRQANEQVERNAAKSTAAGPYVARKGLSPPTTLKSEEYQLKIGDTCTAAPASVI